MQHLHMFVYGQVQGVGFRYFTYTMANKLGVVGWVQNLYDGSVEIEAVATAEIMTRFLALIEQGPRYGRVDRVTVSEVATHKHYSNFNIR